MKEHIKSLDFLRGMAALGVVLCHYGDGLLPTINNNMLSEFLSYGGNGVQMFFVISGFIIPYSITKSNYTINHFWKNIIRRYLRLAPPAYIAMLFSICIYFSAILILNRPINGMSWPGLNSLAIMGNISFTAPLVNTTWYNPIFWTLAIEFQFYVLIGLLLPLILNKKYILSIFISLSILLIGHHKPQYIDWYGWFFGHASFFFLGIIIFLKKENIIKGIPFIIITVLTIMICFYQNSIPRFTFGMLAFCIILFQINISFKLATYLGSISYSLYIIHWPFGILIESITKKLTSIHDYEIGKIILLVFYTLTSILFAHLFNKRIEKRFLSLSKTLK